MSTKAKSNSNPVRNWCFTSYRPETFHGAYSAPEGVRYMVYQHERCPTSGKIHVQGYVELTNSQRLTGVQKLLGDDTIHLETRKGTQEQARAYCMKPETRIAGPWEFGTFSKKSQGKRNDWITIKEEIKEGATYLDLLENHTSAVARYPNAVSKLCSSFSPLYKRDKKTFTIALCGEPGTGKSELAKTMGEDVPSISVIIPFGDKLWLDNYQPDTHKRVIINEFNSSIPLTILNELMDKHECWCQTKGGSVPFVAEELVITSNKPPSEWYPNIKDPNVRNSLYRRIDKAFWLYTEDGSVKYRDITPAKEEPKNFLNAQEFYSAIKNSPCSVAVAEVVKGNTGPLPHNTEPADTGGFKETLNFLTR